MICPKRLLVSAILLFPAGAGWTQGGMKPAKAAGGEAADSGPGDRACGDHDVSGGRALAYDLLGGYAGYIAQGEYSALGALEGYFMKAGLFFPAARFGVSSRRNSKRSLPCGSSSTTCVRGR